MNIYHYEPDPLNMPNIRDNARVTMQIDGETKEIFYQVDRPVRNASRRYAAEFMTAATRQRWHALTVVRCWPVERRDGNDFIWEAV